jgi:hypothetical protein
VPSMGAGRPVPACAVGGVPWPGHVWSKWSGLLDRQERITGRLAVLGHRIQNRISIVARSAGSAFGKDGASSRRAAGALPRWRSHRLRAWFTTSAPTSWRSLKASMMVRSGEYRPMLKSAPGR